MSSKKLDFPHSEFFGPTSCGPLGETLMPCIFKGYREGSSIIVTEVPKGGCEYRTVIDDIHVVSCPEETQVRYLCPPQVRNFVRDYISKGAVAAERLAPETLIPDRLRLAS